MVNVGDSRGEVDGSRVFSSEALGRSRRCRWTQGHGGYKSIEITEVLVHSAPTQMYPC